MAEEIECTNSFDFTQKSWKDDVTFIVEGKPLYACKGVLALVSPVFEAMFSSSFREKDQEEITLPEKSYDDFLEFLQCVYPTSSKTVTKKSVFAVLPLSDEYQAIFMVKRCANVLLQYLAESGEEITSEEVLKCFTFASKYKIEELCKECVQEMRRRDEAIFMENVAEMDKDTMVHFHNEMVMQINQENSEYKTRFMKILLGMPVRLESIEPLQNGEDSSIGTTLELNIDHVKDWPLGERKLSKPKPVLGVKFQIKAFVTNEQEKQLAFFLLCQIPEGWTCLVSAFLCLVITKGNKEKIALSFKIKRKFTHTQNDWGYKNFRAMSALTEDLTTETTSVKLMSHMLVNKPAPE